MSAEPNIPPTSALVAVVRCVIGALSWAGASVILVLAAAAKHYGVELPSERAKRKGISRRIF